MHLFPFPLIKVGSLCRGCWIIRENLQSFVHMVGFLRLHSPPHHRRAQMSTVCQLGPRPNWKQNKTKSVLLLIHLNYREQVRRRIRKHGLSSHIHLGTPPGWSLCSLLGPCYSHALGPKRNIGRELYFFTSDINGRNSQAPRLLEVRKVIALRGGMWPAWTETCWRLDESWQFSTITKIYVCIYTVFLVYIRSISYNVYIYISNNTCVYLHMLIIYIYISSSNFA